MRRYARAHPEVVEEISPHALQDTKAQYDAASNAALGAAISPSKAVSENGCMYDYVVVARFTCGCVRFCCDITSFAQRWCMYTYSSCARICGDGVVNDLSIAGAPTRCRRDVCANS